MRSSPAITLFSEQEELYQKPYSFLFSVLAHGVVIGLVSIGIISAPKVKTPAVAQRYEVRHLDLHTLESEMQRAVRSEIKAPRLHRQAKTSPSGGSPDAQPPVLRQVVQAPRGPQTLVQPDIPKPIALTIEIPVPTVVIWNGKKTPVKTIVPPPPENPPVADVKPSTQLPNEEHNLAELAIPASVVAPNAQPVLPSTTSPVVVSGPKPTPPAPLTTAQGAAQPTPTALMSLSDQHMANGAVTLPPVNSTVSSASPGALAPGQEKNPAQTGQVRPAGKAADKVAGQGSTDAGDPSDHAKDAQGAKTGSAQTGSGLGNRSLTAHITRQKDGQFGSVVVGSSLEAKYPETAELWNGRLSYTVYLPVGLAKSWILQYSLSRADNAAQAGNITRIEAPWPYSIVRPNIAPGAIDADALMIHGFVNQDGRFEALTIAFPPEFPQAQFVLSSLNQWQFRAATQNGQNVKVEVLLIIPEVPE